MSADDQLPARRAGTSLARPRPPARLSSELDLWSDERLTDPYPGYAELRAIGPIVYLRRYGIWAVTSHTLARHVLGDHHTFTSTQGIGLNDTINQMGNGILAADPPEHDAMRLVLAEQLSPRGVGRLRSRIGQEAEEIVGTVVGRGRFDVVTELAEVFPVSVVAGLIGIPPEDRVGLLSYAESAFTCFGPWNSRTERNLPNWAAFLQFCATRVTRDRLIPGGWGAALYDAAESGVISYRTAIELLGAYLGAGMDTTISAISSAVMLFAQHPDQWQLLRAEPALLPSAFQEILRLESPIQVFARVTTRDVEVGGATIHAGSRLAVLYGCANRDENRYPGADRFDIRRKPADHLAFGYGLHGCAGQFLARVETLAILQALQTRADTIDCDAPRYHLNNVTRRLAHLPVQVRVANPR